MRSNRRGVFQEQADQNHLVRAASLTGTGAHGVWRWCWFCRYTETQAKSEVMRWKDDKLPLDVWVSFARALGRRDLGATLFFFPAGRRFPVHVLHAGLFFALPRNHVHRVAAAEYV